MRNAREPRERTIATIQILRYSPSMIVSWLARRFLMGKKRNTFLSFISMVSLFGVCLGVAALTVVMSVMEGFESQLQSIATGSHSHITLLSSRQLILNRYDLEERVRKIGADRIEAVSPIVFSEVMLAMGSRVVGSIMEGVEKDTLKQVTDIEKHLVKGEMPEGGVLGHAPTIILGSALAEALNAKIGDTISVISPFFDQENMQPRARRFLVSGLINTGMYEYDSKYSMIQGDEARDFFKFPIASAVALRIKTKDASQSVTLARKLQAELGFPYQTKDWTDLNRNLLYAIRLQKSVIFVILTAIVVVAAFNIMSTLMMMMSEKKKEMSILKAMGLSPWNSAKVFVSVGLWIGGSGAALGVALGLLLGFILSKTQFIKLPADIYFISYLPVEVRPFTLLLISFCAIIVAVLATLYPAYRVAKESPVEGLRYE